MALIRSDSGLIEAEDTFAACPAWMNEEEDAPGRITYPADGTVVYTTGANAQYAYLVYNTALLDANEWVVRVKSKATVGADYGVPVCHLHDTAIIPAGAFAWATPPHRSVMRFFSPGAPGITSVAAWETTAANVWTTGAFAYDTYYIFETVHGAVQDTLRYMLATDLTAYLKTGAYNHVYGNDPWLVVGDGATTNFRGTLITDSIQVFESLSIAVTSLGAGNAVRIYDASDTVIDSAVEAGGTATLDVHLLEYPFTGYLKVWTDNTYTTELAKYPTGVGNATDIWGGDDYDYTGPDVGPIPTPPGGPWIVSGWDSTDSAGMPHSGRIVGEDGQVYNYNESGVLVPIAGMIVPVPVHATGRFKREDSTDINIADNLERRE